MKYLESPWAILFMLMGFFIFIEGLHMIEHEHCRPTPQILLEEY